MRDSTADVRVFLEVDDPPVFVRDQDSEARRLVPRYRLHRDRHRSISLPVPGNHRSIVHRIDVVSSEDQHVTVRATSDIEEVMINRICCTAIPPRGRAAEVRLENDHATAPFPIEIPGATMADMLVQRVRPVLRKHGNVVQAGIHTVAQREIDDPIFAAEWNGGLGTLAREDGESFSLTTRQDHDGDIAHRAPPPVLDRFPVYHSLSGRRTERSQRATPPT